MTIFIHVVYLSIYVSMFGVLSHLVMSDFLRPHGLQPVRLLCPWGFSRPEYWRGLPYPPPGDLPKPGIEHRSLALQADSLPSEPPGKHKNTGVGSLSLLQRLFLTQELNPGFPALQAVSVPAELPGKPHTILDQLMHLKSLRLQQHF